MDDVTTLIRRINADLLAGDMFAFNEDMRRLRILSPTDAEYVTAIFHRRLPRLVES